MGPLDTPIPAGAVVSPRAQERKRLSIYPSLGPTPEIAAKNIFTAAEAVHGMSLIVPDTRVRDR